MVVRAARALHVAPEDAAAREHVLEVAQTHVVQIGIHAAEAVHVDVTDGVDAVDVLPEALILGVEPGVVLAHEELVVLVGP